MLWLNWNGNAAGTFAEKAFMSSKERKHSNSLSLNMQYLEIDNSPGFPGAVCRLDGV